MSSPRLRRRGRLPRCAAAAALVAWLLIVALVAGCGDDPVPPTPAATVTESPVPAATATVTPGAGASPASTPAAATATRTATPSVAPTATVAPLDEDDESLRAELADVGARVAELRDVPAPEPTRARLVSDEELSAILAEVLDRPDSRRWLEGEGRLWAALGMIDEQDDFADLYLAMLESQVIGLYDDESKALWMRQRGEFSAFEELVAAHEYVHFLQDREFDLGALSDLAESNRDFDLAIAALVEGDASRTQQQYVTRYFSQAEAIEALTGAALQPSSRPIPETLLEQLAFPYLYGLRFVSSRLEGEADVATLFSRPPQSTEQVLHPERYGRAEQPIAVRPPDLAGEVEGWSVLDTNVIGEFTLRNWIEFLSSTADAPAAAEGWGGDQYVVLSDDEGAQLALVARLAWDDAEEADEFVTVLSRAVGRPGVDARDEWFAQARGRALAVVPRGDSELIIALAPEEDAARRLAGAAAGAAAAR